MIALPTILTVSGKVKTRTGNAVPDTKVFVSYEDGKPAESNGKTLHGD